MTDWFDEKKETGDSKKADEAMYYTVVNDDTRLYSCDGISVSQAALLLVIWAETDAAHVIELPGRETVYRIRRQGGMAEAIRRREWIDLETFYDKLKWQTVFSLVHRGYAYYCRNKENGRDVMALTRSGADVLKRIFGGKRDIGTVSSYDEFLYTFRKVGCVLPFTAEDSASYKIKTSLLEFSVTNSFPGGHLPQSVFSRFYNSTDWDDIIYELRKTMPTFGGAGAVEPKDAEGGTASGSNDVEMLPFPYDKAKKIPGSEIGKIKKIANPRVELYSMKPKEITSELDKYVYGQDEAKRAVALLLWNHVHGRKRNLAIAGPSGCGKTEIFRAAKRLYRNIYIFDASDVTQEGWTGKKKVGTVFENMIANGMSQFDIERSIVVFDEFDKLVSPQYAKGGENVSYCIQSEFLSMIEGTTVSTSSCTINTSGISFVFLGAFESLTMKREEDVEREIGFGAAEKDMKKGGVTIDDLIGYGVRPELAGRISNIAMVNGFGRDDYARILREDGAGIVSRAASQYGIPNIHMSEQTIAELAEKADSTGLGIRYLMNEIARRLDDNAYEEGRIIGEI